MFRKHFKAVIILLVFLIVGCSPILSYKTQTEEIIKKWDDAMKIAGSTGRISLSTPVARLQEIRREAEKVKIPSSLKNCHQHLLNAMDFSIESFLVFMRNEEYASRDLIKKASNEMDEWVMCLNPALKKQREEEERKKAAELKKREEEKEQEKRIKQANLDEKTILGKISGLNVEAVRIILGDPILLEQNKKGEVIWGMYRYESKSDPILQRKNKRGEVIWGKHEFGGKTITVYFHNGIVSRCSN